MSIKNLSYTIENFDEHIAVKSNTNPLVEKTFEIGRFRYYPNFIVGEFNEGAHVTKQNAAEPIQLAQEIYGTEKPLVYISHRLNSYSMDPVGYQEVSKLFPNFKGFAIVSKNRYRRMIAKLEKLFIKKPIAVFYDLDEALVWAESLLNE